MQAPTTFSFEEFAAFSPARRFNARLADLEEQMLHFTHFDAQGGARKAKVHPELLDALGELIERWNLVCEELQFQRPWGFPVRTAILARHFVPIEETIRRMAHANDIPGHIRTLPLDVDAVLGEQADALRKQVWDRLANA